MARAAIAPSTPSVMTTATSRAKAASVSRVIWPTASLEMLVTCAPTIRRLRSCSG